MNLERPIRVDAGTRRRRRRLAGTAALVIALVAVTTTGGFWIRAQLRASLPALDGTARVHGLDAPVTVTRDALGIPTITGASREDVARALGFLHAQDRFFQMDLARRRAAGELAALVGARALPLDREIRIHRFRAEAAQAVSLLDARQRRLLDAYTAGVNAGLAALESPPFEYLVLRQQPLAWRPEDTFLVVLSMFITLQDTDGSYEATLATMQDVLPPAVVDFLDPAGTEWDAPIEGPSFEVPPIPGPGIYDLRRRRKGKPAVEFPPQNQQARTGVPVFDESAFADAGLKASANDAIGSNSWVVAGSLSSDGHPLLANDMHLAIRVPNTWYRAAFEWPDPSEPSGRHFLVGVTLPGVPAMVVGSNTHVAWGFTNSYADWSDIVLLEVDPVDPTRYRTPDGWRTFETHMEEIAVAGEAPVHDSVRWTIWGPVLAPDHRGRPRAYRWVAHAADRLASALVPLETARTVQEAFGEANGLGTPGQNIIAADESGAIGWSIYGAIPRRTGSEGRLPASWADGANGWNGWLDPAEYPRVVNPASGRIWTANQRVVHGDMLQKLGDGSYEVGSRATIIRDRLMANSRFSTADMLGLQLDTSADFLARWRDLLVRTLSPASLRDHRERAAVRDIVAHGWSGRASPDSVAYRLTRAFREQVSQDLIRFMLAECYEADPAFDYGTIRRREGPIWKLVTAQPHHLLDPRFDTWSELLVAAVDAVIASTATGWSSDLHARVWSEYNVTAYHHPLSGSLPLVGRWLDMPARALPGDLFTVQMHWGSNGASERMVVTPGRESEGIMHMPTGQSGHPLSPYYANSHDAWASGEPTPLLPGPPQHTLTLMP